MQEYKIIEDYLTPNKYSRPQWNLNKVKGIVIHWVANPNTSAKANRNFFENRKYGKSGYGSAHEIVDLNGYVLLCIPPDEMAYHVGSKSYTKRALAYLSSYPNNCTYGIECTHIDWKGRMADRTYKTLVERVADLCMEFDLKAGIEGDIWLHQEVVGWKDCHRWFVNNNNEWHKFLNLVEKRRLEKLKKRAGELIEVTLANWQKELGESSIENLSKKGLLNNPEEWKNNLGKNVPQWLFWTMMDRITNIK